MLKGLALALTVLLALLQYRLWLGQGGIEELREVRQRVATLEAANQHAARPQCAPGRRGARLKTGLDAIEERARSDIGMVRTDEQFFWVPDVAVETEPVVNPVPAKRLEASR